MVTVTLVLVSVAAAAGVYIAGYERTKNAASRVANNTFTILMGAIMAGLAVGDMVIQTAIQEPFAALSVVAGFIAWLGIDGLLSGVTGTQVFIGVLAAALVIMALTGGDD